MPFSFLWFLKYQTQGLHKERLPGSSGLTMRSEPCTEGGSEAPDGNNLPRGKGEDLGAVGGEAH